MPTVNPVNTINYLVPAEGNTHGAVVTGNFSATPFDVDWQQYSQQNGKFIPQGVFIDNTQGTGDLTLTIPQVPYNIICKQGSVKQAQFPAPNNQTCSIVGSGQATLIFVDFPVLPSAGDVIVDGTVNVNLQSSAITLPVQPSATGTGGVPYSVQQQPANMTAEYLTLTGSTVSASVTPPANSNLRKLVLSITDNATLAAAGYELITITLNGVTIFEENVYIPAAALANSLMGYRRDLTFDGAAANVGASGTLVVTIGTALATGIMDVNAYFA